MPDGGRYVFDGNGRTVSFDLFFKKDKDKREFKIFNFPTYNIPIIVFGVIFLLSGLLEIFLGVTAFGIVIFHPGLFGFNLQSMGTLILIFFAVGLTASAIGYFLINNYKNK